ncbi:MAG: hypothetical protein AAB838_04155 [Patescibacteria group bacterium]
MITFKNQIRKIFNDTKEISCPAFTGEAILFNAKGINHLLYKGNRSKRDISRIQTNIRLLPRAIKVLRLMPFFQEESFYEKDKILFKYWAFEAVVEERRVKVVVRQIGNGQKVFWSVIPAWRKDRFGILNAKSRKLDEDD